MTPKINTPFKPSFINHLGKIKEGERVKIAVQHDPSNQPNSKVIIISATCAIRFPMCDHALMHRVRTVFPFLGDFFSGDNAAVCVTKSHHYPDIQKEIVHLFDKNVISAPAEYTGLELVDGKYSYVVVKTEAGLMSVDAYKMNALLNSGAVVSFNSKHPLEPLYISDPLGLYEAIIAPCRYDAENHIRRFIDC